MRRLLLSITMLLFTVASSVAGNLGNQFVTAKLAYGASVDIPKSWQVMRGNEMRAIETAVGAAIDLSGYARLVDGTESLIVSSFPDRRLYAGVTVTSIVLRGSSRSSAATLNEAQLKSGDLTIRQGMEAIQFFSTGRTYDVALSTSVAAEDVNGVVLKRIADSFSAP
jgi:hypothetical protein